MSNQKSLIFTGGGSGGHVVPAMTLIEHLCEKNIGNLNLAYVGSKKEIEARIVPAKGIQYHSISTGKLRRYFSIQNFMDIFNIIKGVLDSIIVLNQLRSEKTLVFATGGFVCVPVAIAAKILGIPFFLHEQTSRAGLANRICSRFAKKVFISFKASESFFPRSKTVFSGYPLRPRFFKSVERDLKVKGRVVPKDKKLFLVTGGGNGSFLLNEMIKKNLNELKNDFFIIHQVGSQFFEEYREFEDENYIVTDFLGDEMADLMKMSDVVLSRAGAGTVSELLVVKKPSVFIPLAIAQKNEQFHNAMEAKEKLGSVVIEEKDLDGINLVQLVKEVQLKQSSLLTKREDHCTASEILINEILNELEG